MKIWQKSLIALGTLGTAAAGVAVGLTVGYSNYEYNTHISRGSFSTSIPTDLKNAKTYFSDPHDSYKKIADIDTDTLRADGQDAIDYAKSYLRKNGIQPMQVVEFAGTRFINDVPIYIQTETFLGFINWFKENGEWGPEVSALDYIKLTGETTNDGTLGAFASDNKTANITYYIGQFLGRIKVSSNSTYDEMDKVSLLMMMVPGQMQDNYKFGMMYKFNKTALTMEEVKDVASQLENTKNKFNASLATLKTIDLNTATEDTLKGLLTVLCNIDFNTKDPAEKLLLPKFPSGMIDRLNTFLKSGHDKLPEIYSVNFNRTVGSKDYYDIYMDNSRGILDKVMNYEPSLATTKLQPVEKIVNGKSTIVMEPKEVISPNTNISMLDLLAANNKIPHGLSLDFLKYTILHEYGHHQLNTSGSRDSSEQPVMAKPISQAGLTLANQYINIDALNEYFSARIPELKAVRMNSLMHVAPAHTDPSNYPFVVLQYHDGNTGTWKTLSPQEVFDIQSDGTTVGTNSLTHMIDMKSIRKFATDHGISLMGAITLINMDVWNSTVTPKNFVGEKIPVFIKTPTGINIADRLSMDASGVYDLDTNNAGQWISQFVDIKGKHIFDNTNYIDAKALKTTITSTQAIDIFTGQPSFNKDGTPQMTDKVVVPRIWPEVLTSGTVTVTLTNGTTIDVYDGNEINSDPTILISASTLKKFNKVEDAVKIPALSHEAQDMDGTPYYSQAFIDKITKQIDPDDPTKGYTISPRTGSDSTFVDKAITSYFSELNYKGLSKRFATKQDLKQFYDDKISHILFNFITEEALLVQGIDDGNGDKNKVPIDNKNAATLNEAVNEKVASIPTTNENVFGYETSYSEILTRDYAQLLFDSSYATPIAESTQGALNSGIHGLQDINPLLQGTSLNPKAIVSSITDDWSKDSAQIFSDGLTIWKEMQDGLVADGKELVLEKTLLAKDGVGIIKDIEGFNIWTIMGWTKAISPGGTTPGVMSDLRMRMNLECNLYDQNGDSVRDTDIRIKDLDGTTVQDRVRAMWMYVLHQKGIYGERSGENIDRTVAGIWHSLDKDAYTMWGYLKKDTRAKYVTFEAKDGTRKSFKMNFGAHLYYHEKQFDPNHKKTIQQDGYEGWSIDYKTMGTYSSADLTSGEYRVFFSDENQQEIAGLFSMGKGESHRNYITNNNFFHSIASVYFKNEDENDDVTLVVKDYF